MATITLPPEEILILLTETPLRLTEIADSRSSAQLQTPPQPGEWSATEVLAHMRACADVWGDCIRAILAEDVPTLRAINPRSWIKRTDYRALEFHASLQSFTTQRAELLAVLEPLAQEDWERRAIVTGAGAALERTVRFYAQWLARHEQPHIKQITRTISAIVG